jgi:hypothetical protein
VVVVPERGRRLGVAHARRRLDLRLPHGEPVQVRVAVTVDRSGDRGTRSGLVNGSGNRPAGVENAATGSSQYRSETARTTRLVPPPGRKIAAPAMPYCRKRRRVVKRPLQVFRGAPARSRDRPR